MHQQTVLCNHCGRHNPGGSRFCRECGTGLVRESAPPISGSITGQTATAPSALPAGRRCGDCGTENAPGMNFCRNCGQRLVAAAPAGSGGDRRVRPAAAAASVVCRACGATTPAGFTFCQGCGARLEAMVGASPAGSQDLAVLEAPARSRSLRPTPVPGSLPAPAAGPERPGATPPAAATPGWGRLVAISRDGRDAESYPLATESIDIGRSDAQVRFPEDRHLAARHARIERRAGVPTIVPLDPLNGVLLRVRRTAYLAHGAVFMVGRELLRFELVTEEERLPAPLVQHGVHLIGSPAREPWGRLSQLVPSGGVRDVRYLVATEVIVGREEGEIVFRDDEFLSRAHAALRWQDGRCTLEDLRSSNGTFLRLTGPSALAPGDQLRLGDRMFRFEP
jgi:pSer/pThr/pTyr-binding forkhead associated (FHA) protein/ribosomal protein L40E